MDHLDLATLFHLYVVNNLPLAFIAFAMFTAFITFVLFVAFDAFSTFFSFISFVVLIVFDMLPSATFHDAPCCEQLDIFVSRQAHRHLIEYISRCAMNGVFDSSLLETIVPTLLRGI